MLDFRRAASKLRVRQLCQQHAAPCLKTAWYRGPESIGNWAAAVRGRRGTNAIFLRAEKASRVRQTGFIVCFYTAPASVYSKVPLSQRRLDARRLAVVNAASRPARRGSTDSLLRYWGERRGTTRLFVVELAARKAQHVVVCARERAGGGPGLCVT